MLLVLSYPQISRGDSSWLSAMPARHSYLQNSILPPHFTFVFPLSDVGQDELIKHVKKQLKGQGPIQFVMRSSLLVKDDSSANWYVVLVPDEGFSRIVKLHDRLYTGILRDRLRLDLPFIPHITIGYSEDVTACKQLVDQLNSEGFEVRGTIDALEIVSKQGVTAETAERVALA